MSDSAAEPIIVFEGGPEHGRIIEGPEARDVLTVLPFRTNLQPELASVGLKILVRPSLVAASFLEKGIEASRKLYGRFGRAERMTARHVYVLHEIAGTEYLFGHMGVVEADFWD